MLIYTCKFSSISDFFNEYYNFLRLIVVDHVSRVQENTKSERLILTTFDILIYTCNFSSISDFFNEYYHFLGLIVVDYVSRSQEIISNKLHCPCLSLLLSPY